MIRKTMKEKVKELFTKNTTSPFISVKRSSIHSKGVFAKKDIPKGTAIIEYVGKKITKKESSILSDLVLLDHKENPSKGAVYIFELNKKYDIDGNVRYNTARLINHSCNPNAEALNDNGKIIIFAKKNITKGDEITYNYGYDIDHYEEHPCRCGSKNCVGYIVKEEDWPKLKRMLQKKGIPISKDFGKKKID